jgi:hypothetical protein
MSYNYNQKTGNNPFYLWCYEVRTTINNLITTRSPVKAHELTRLSFQLKRLPELNPVAEAMQIHVLLTSTIPSLSSQTARNELQTLLRRFPPRVD